jgi:hypothetical protein
VSELFEGKLGEAVKKIKVLKAELRKTSASVSSGDFKVASLKLFNAHPEIEGVYWTQYTPHFNDEESCHFSTGSPLIKFTTEALAKHYLEYPDPEYPEGYCYISFTAATEQSALAKDVIEFSTWVERNDDLLLALFGDHVQVTITREGIVVDDYQHD